MNELETRFPTLRAITRWGLYPASWCVLLGGFLIIWATEIDPRVVWGATIGGLVSIFLLIEFAIPYQARWRMTLRSFLADLRFAALNAASVAGLSALLALFAISLAEGRHGPASAWPPPLQLAACLLIFEAVNYALHRAMHELPGPLGRRLWAIHAAHHLPPRLYLAMHAVFHPLNGVMIQGLAIIVPVWFMGYDPRVVAMFLMINGMHGTISHFNVDIRMGWLNYMFVGPELHRYHHSANVEESRNYGATLSIYDFLFGTLVYRPGVPPAQLGVHEPELLPAYEQTWQVLKLPFSGHRAE